MGKRLFVGSLPFETTDTQLQELFSACGRVESAKVILDKASGRSKGFGFVEMATDIEAQAAIQKFHGSSLGSRTLVVNEARPMEDRKGGGGFRDNRGGGGNSQRPSNNVGSFRQGYGGQNGMRNEGGFGGQSRGPRPQRDSGNRGSREGGWGGGKDGFDALGGGDAGRRRNRRYNGGRKDSRDSRGDDFGNRW